MYVSTSGNPVFKKPVFIKGCDLEQKKSANCEKITLLRANQIARFTSGFKMGVINLSS